MDCIFCKILAGEIPSYKVYENDNVIAILDISQATKGHTIIIAKKHVKNIYELSEKDSAEIFKVVPKLANAIKQAFNPIGMNVLVNADRPLQSVMHLHIHLIPRYEDDELVMKFKNNMDSLSSNTYEELKNRIIKEIE